eukprot:gb/GEZJ01007586.1/.p1 GENE.gb/GEZJ01007586.1/~~gb/GEZJ01007586.1/.p1  ORF type:complete len:110 (-),score=8.71 gb/GEZJ01007586.1/:24-353(-)
MWLLLLYMKTTALKRSMKISDGSVLKLHFRRPPHRGSTSHRQSREKMANYRERRIARTQYCNADRHLWLRTAEEKISKIVSGPVGQVEKTEDQARDENFSTRNDGHGFL